MPEIWKPIKGYERYHISNLGRIRSHRGLLIPKLHKSGYYVVALYNKDGKKHRYIHRLLGEYFVLGRKPGLVVDHIDGNTLNNNLDNLQWITQKENMSKGTIVSRSIETHSKVYKIEHACGKIEIVKNLTEYARKHGLVPQHLNRVAHGVRKHCKGLVVTLVEAN